MPPGAQPLTCVRAGRLQPRSLWPLGHGEPRLSPEAISMLRHVDAFARTVTQLEQFLETQPF